MIESLMQQKIYNRQNFVNNNADSSFTGVSREVGTNVIVIKNESNYNCNAVLLFIPKDCVMYSNAGLVSSLVYSSQNDLSHFTKNICKVRSIENVIEFNNSLTSYEKTDVSDKAKVTLLSVSVLDKNNERGASRYIMKEVEQKIFNKEMSLLNEILLAIDSYELTPRTSVALLRSTLRAKKSLPAWHKALIFIEERIIAKGLDSRPWLVGLKK